MDSAEPAGEPEWTMTMESHLAVLRSALVVKMASTPRAPVMLARGERETPFAPRGEFPVSSMARRPMRAVMDSDNATHTTLVRMLALVRTVTFAGMLLLIPDADDETLEVDTFRVSYSFGHCTCNSCGLARKLNGFWRSFYNGTDWILTGPEQSIDFG